MAVEQATESVAQVRALLESRLAEIAAESAELELSLGVFARARPTRAQSPRRSFEDLLAEFDAEEAELERAVEVLARANRPSGRRRSRVVAQREPRPRPKPEPVPAR
jgi:hypothetical protein